MKPPEIRLFVLDEAWEAIGGVDTFRRCLLPALARQLGHLWWVNHAGISARRIEEMDLSGITVLDTFPPTFSARGLPLAAIRRMPPAVAPILMPQIQNFLSRSYLRGLCRRLGATHLLELAVFRKAFPDFGIPAFGFVHDLDYENRGSSPIDAIFRDWLHQAARLFAISTQTRNELLSLDPSAADRVEVLLPPPPPRPAAPPSREANRFRRSEPVLFYPASALPRKGHAVLLAALAQLAGKNISFHCYLTGGGTEAITRSKPADEPRVEAVRVACRPSLKALEGRLTVLGLQPKSVVEELYAACDFVVLPSLYEGYGLVLSEALLRGKPVVASQLAPFAEQMEFFNAASQVHWMPPGDSMACAAAVGTLLLGNGQFPPTLPAVQARLASWTWDAFAGRLIAAIAAPNDRRAITPAIAINS